MAQLVARFVRNEEVRGSNPLRSTEEIPAPAGIFCFVQAVLSGPESFGGGGDGGGEGGLSMSK